MKCGSVVTCFFYKLLLVVEIFFTYIYFEFSLLYKMYNNVSYVTLYILGPLLMVVIFFVRKPVIVYLLP